MAVNWTPRTWAEGDVWDENTANRLEDALRSIDYALDDVGGTAGVAAQQAAAAAARLDALEAGGGGGGGGVEQVSGVVDLDGTGSAIREFYTTGAATIEGVAFGAGTAVVFRRTPGGVWGYKVVDGWTPVSGATTTTTTAAGTTTTTTTAAGTTTTTTTTAGTTTTTTTAGTTTTTTTIPAITDDFNRANSTTGLGTTTTGQTWEQIGTGIVGISGNAAYRATSNAFAVVDFGQADMAVSSKVTVGGDYFGGPCARVVDENNHYRIDTGAGGGITAKLIKFIGGTQSNVSGTTATIAVGDVLTISCKEEGGATRVRLLVNGVEKVSVLDSTAGRPNGTKGGIRPFNNGTMRIDDFRIEAPA